MFFATQETPMPPAAAGEEDAIPGGNESRAGGKDQNVRATFAPSSGSHYLDWKPAFAAALPGFESGMPPDLLGISRLRPAADEYHHAASHGAFIAGLAIELHKLLATGYGCVADGITPAFGQRLEAVVHSMEAVDDCHRLRLAYLRTHLDTQMPAMSCGSATSTLAPRTRDRPSSPS
eukprot:jgi/Tetstr1/424927/TSEL_015420.t1